MDGMTQVYTYVMIFIAVGTVAGLLWNVLMSKTITTWELIWVHKGDCF